MSGRLKYLMRQHLPISSQSLAVLTALTMPVCGFANPNAEPPVRPLDGAPNVEQVAAPVSLIVAEAARAQTDSIIKDKTTNAVTKDTDTKSGGSGQISGDRLEQQRGASANPHLDHFKLSPQRPAWSKNEPFEHYKAELQTYNKTLNSLGVDPKFKEILENNLVAQKAYAADLAFAKSELERVSKIQRPPNHPKREPPKPKAKFPQLYRNY